MPASLPAEHTITGWRCAACGTEIDIATVFPWQCPKATADDRHHVLLAQGAHLRPEVVVDDPNPFVRYDRGLAWAAFAAAHGMEPTARLTLVRELDRQVAAVAGVGFRATPLARSTELSDALDFSPQGGVWVKDQTGDVAGSQKARHLFTILLHLRAAEELGLAPWSSASASASASTSASSSASSERPPLAISSCGNAAIAASTLAAAVGWPIQVFVPPWASDAVVARLTSLGADLRVCPRRDGDPPGDPCIHRFREAVAAGAIPFGVQGPENALCLDGGRTLGWELLDQAAAAGVAFDRVFVQVGGGAFAATIGAALRSAEPSPHLQVVQAAGCAPLAGAWRRARQLPDGPLEAAHHWERCMRIWGTEGEGEPFSAADGILDDETYDWVAIVEALVATDGDVVVASEDDVVEAHRVLDGLTGIDATATGTAGFAGLLAIRSSVGRDECVAVIASGVTRR